MFELNNLNFFFKIQASARRPSSRRPLDQKLEALHDSLNCQSQIQQILRDRLLRLEGQMPKGAAGGGSTTSKLSASLDTTKSTGAKGNPGLLPQW